MRKSAARSLFVTVVAAATVALALPRVARAAEPTAAPPIPWTGVDPAEVQKLRVELDALKARTEAAERTALAAQKQLDRETQERKAEAAVARERLEARVEDLQSATGQLVRANGLGLKLLGFVQTDLTMWRQSSVDAVDPSTGEPLNETRFSLRRARLRAELDYKFVFGAFEIDANTVKGPQVRPISFEAGVRWKAKEDGAPPYLAASMGMIRTPFGLEVLQSDKERLFLERSHLALAFFPGEYDLGLRVFGGWRFLRYQLAVMNGNPIGEKLFPDRDPNAMKDVVGRVGVDVKATKRVRVEVGVSATWGKGFHRNIAAGKDSLVWRDANENGIIDTGELQAVTATTAQPAASFTRYAFGGDARLTATLPKVGDLVVYGEAGWGTNMDRGLVLADPIFQAHDLRELGFYVGATQELTKYGQVGIRYDWYDGDRDATRLRNATQVPAHQVYSTLAVVAAARLPGYGRLILEYDHNTNPLGRDKNGVPRTLPDDALTLRAEVTF